MVHGVTGAGGIFLYTNGAMTTLASTPPSLDNYYFAKSVNNAGQVLLTYEQYQYENTKIYTYLYANGGFTSIATVPNGLSTGVDGVVLNSIGSIAGTASLSSGAHAFLHSNGTTKDLGTLPGGTYSAGDQLEQPGDGLVQ
jgi:probable HAF family extracellular repeat protein